ncbi:hyaluronan and proteoglycan link protein 4 [Rhinoraja longicauda]
MLCGRIIADPSFLLLAIHTATLLAGTRSVHVSDAEEGSVVVHTAPEKILTHRGASVILPCRYHSDAGSEQQRGIRIKWSKDSESLQSIDVLVALGEVQKVFGEFGGRVQLREDREGDASLIMRDLTLQDDGRYRCEVTDGLQDAQGIVTLSLEGVVFPYHPRQGQQTLRFADAKAACAGQDATLASYQQLQRAWEQGLHWCTVAWLSDGSVHIPAPTPQHKCGTSEHTGIRNYGYQHKDDQRYDAFCFTSTLKGKVYFLKTLRKLSYGDAVRACERQASSIAKVGQLYAAWRLQRLDQCRPGWLADGSVRYPIVRPRARCGGSEPGVRSFGFPDRKLRLYGVYCFRKRE